MDDNCILELCDPEGLPAGEAIRLAREVSRAEPNLAATLGAYVWRLAASPESEPRLVQRALTLLHAVADVRCFTTTCRRIEEEGSPVSRAMVRWLLAGMPRRAGRVHPAAMVTGTKAAGLVA